MSVKTVKPINESDKKAKLNDIEIEEIFIPELELDEPTLQLPSLSLLNQYKERSNRVIWLVDEIKDQICEVSKLILQWNREDTKKNIPVKDRQPIILILSSPGGDLYSMWGLVDIIEMSQTEVITVNLNYAFSAASIIFLSAKKRYCLPNSQILFHNGSASMGGDYNSAQAMNDSWKKQVGRMQDYIISHTVIPKSTLTKKLKTDWFLTSDEQIKYGVATDILRDINVIMNLTESNSSKDTLNKTEKD